MSRHVHRLSTISDLDAALTASHTQPIVLFKHSPTCGTSAMASEEIDDLLADESINAEVHVVFVREARAVSDAIVERFRVRHESPQVLVVHRGAVIWHRSHFHVTAEQIRAALMGLTDAA